MKRSIVLAAAAVALVACSEGVGERPSGASSPPGTRPAGGMAPGSCAEVPFGTIVPASGKVTADRPATVGVSVRRGSGGYVIDELRVEVLPPGSRVSQSAGETDPFATPHENAVARIERRSVAATDAEFTVRFDGKDARGGPLPAGSYPVVFTISSTAAGACTGPPARADGLLTTLEWTG